LQHHGLDTYQLHNGLFSNKSWHKRYLVKQGKRIVESVDVNIGVSHKTLLCLNDFGPVRANNKYVLYNGVDKEKFFPLPKEIVSTHRDEYVIGCVGNFNAIKDQLTLLKAIHKLKGIISEKVILKFVGTGPTLSKCKEFVQENSLQFVSFISNLNHDELNEFYNSLDLFVLPSYYEAFGCVYVEALQCGVPFIGVYGQGIEEMLPANLKSYCLIEKHDFDKLADLIRSHVEGEVPAIRTVNPIGIHDLVTNFKKEVVALNS
jgi:glycosyltransferase involved in cell wall biosynthesis